MRRAPDVRRVLRRGRRRSGTYLVAHVHDRSDEGPARIAVIASRRVGGAVQRNRAKRLLREAATRVTFPPGVDVGLVARAAAAGGGLAVVLRDLESLVEQMFES